MTSLTAAQQTYLNRDQRVGAFVVNLFLNAGIAWLVFRERSRVPVWGAGGLLQDLEITLFLLPFLMCLIVTLLVRNDARAGRVAPAEGDRRSQPGIGWWPHRLVPRAAVLGALGLLIGTPLCLGMAWIAGAVDVSLTAVVIGKGVGTAIVAAILAPRIARAALFDRRA